MITTSDVNDRVYDGFEWIIDGRLSNGAFFGGSFATERTSLNFCDPEAFDGGREELNQTFWCDSPRVWQRMYKAHAAYPLPGAVILSAFVQGYPWPDIDANQNINSASAGVVLTNSNFDIDLLPHDTLFLPFQRKVDLRVMRRLNVGNTQIAPVLDVFNLFNTNTVTSVNSTYGSNWQRVVAIMQARYLRIGLELER